jgi:pimeloyl-ACP methyl ester carboxylesterase
MGKKGLMSSLDKPNVGSTIRLRDGRALGLMETGWRDGPTIFHFHGHGSSRLEVRLLDETAARLGVRLIGLDRPGIGCSDAKADFRILDWPDDVQEAADQLGIERFAVEGLSAGGIYALACAYKIPHRLTACGLISSTAPSYLIAKAGPRWMRTMWWLGERFPWLFWPLIRLVSWARGSTQASIEAWLLRISSWLGEPDQRVLAIHEIRADCAQALAEGFRQGRKANLREALADFQPWGFKVERIPFKKIFMWHGEQDRIMPATLARLLAQALPQCIATFYPNEGHISVMANHAQDILDTMMAE